MPDLFDGKHVLTDIALIKREFGNQDGLRIEAFLDEVGASDDALWALKQRNQDRNFSRPFFNSCVIDWMNALKYNMYRMRPTAVVPVYRMLYAFDPQHEEFHVLAVVRKLPKTTPGYDQKKHYDYEPNHHISVRVLAEYDDIGIPLIG